MRVSLLALKTSRFDVVDFATSIIKADLRLSSLSVFGVNVIAVYKEVISSPSKMKQNGLNK